MSLIKDPIIEGLESVAVTGGLETPGDRITVEGMEIRCQKLPALAKCYEGIVLILGSGTGIFEDIRDAKELIGQKHFDAMAVNMSFLAYKGEVKHLVTVHQEKIEHFYELAKTLPEQRFSHIHTHSHMVCPGVEAAWPIVDQNGTSSFFAVKVAILLGYTKIILCGVPLNGSRRFYDSPYDVYENNFGCEAIEHSWHQYKPQFGGRVRSMSGKTAQIYGKPDKEWIHGNI